MKKLSSTEGAITVSRHNGDVYLCGKFNDGYALLKDKESVPYVMKYPKGSELTPAMVSKIKESTLRELTDYLDIALVYGIAYTIGDNIQITEMKDEEDYKGKCGKIEHIDDIGQLHGTWGGLAVIPECDEFQKK